MIPDTRANDPDYIKQKIQRIADVITQDPDASFDRLYLYRRNCDRSMSIDLVYSPINESVDVGDDFDTIGDLEHDYPIFMDSLKKNRDNLESLTMYSFDDYAQKGARLYKLKGVDAGFAVASDGDIISVHNSEPKSSSYRGIGRQLVKLAKRYGGTKLDHFDFPKLNEIYSSEGFKEYDRVAWDDQYAPANWDYNKYGTPDLIFRSL